jgi:hypothetical protein
LDDDLMGEVGKRERAQLLHVAWQLPFCTQLKASSTCMLLFAMPFSTKENGLLRC